MLYLIGLYTNLLPRHSGSSKPIYLMKRILIIFIIIISSSSLSLAQRSEGWRDSVKLEAQKFFKQVAKIELIELIPYHVTRKYRNRYLGFLGITKKEEYQIEKSIILSNSQLDTSHIGNRHELNYEEFDKLFDLLYESESSNSRGACYNPRHGIIFYNSNGEINGYLEICFECYQMYSFPETPNIGPPVSDKFNELKKLFTQ